MPVNTVLLRVRGAPYQQVYRRTNAAARPAPQAVRRLPAAARTPGGSSGADGPHGPGYVIAAPGAQLSWTRKLAAIKCSADRAQLDAVSYPLPIGVGCQSWSVQPSRQC